MEWLSKEPPKSPNIWATFTIRLVTESFKTPPNLVTLMVNKRELFHKPGHTDGEKRELFHKPFSDISSRLHLDEVRYIPSSGKLDLGAVLGRARVGALAVLHLVRWGVLARLRRGASEREAILQIRWRGHLHVVLLEAGAGGEWRGEVVDGLMVLDCDRLKHL